MSVTVEAAGTNTLAGRQFVTFRIRDEVFGVPLGEVQEIIRVPDLVQVPLSPPSLEGIANLRGAVLPVTNLRRVFGAQDAQHDDATRVVVVNRGGAPVGFVVDRMASVITAEADEVESAASIEATVRSDVLRGVVKRASGMILLLNPDRLAVIEPSAAAQRGDAARDHASSESRSSEGGVAGTAEIQLVSFEASGQEYAFPIEDVQEIVQVPSHMTVVPQAHSHVVGLMTLRDRLLPLIALRRMFGLEDVAVDEHSRIVVVSLGGRDAASVGIVVDTVKEVLRVNRALVDPVPPLLAKGGAGDFKSICRLNGGQRMVTILSARQMFHNPALRAAISASGAGNEQEDMTVSNPSTVQALVDDEEQFVVFLLAGEEYGVPIESVQEIVRVPDELTRVPKAADFMEGVVNLRGTVLPVIDQRRRFALDEVERNDRQRIMVLTIAGVKTGFIVDQVSEVLKIPRHAIGRAPALSAEQARLIRRVANLDKARRMILLLEPEGLLNSAEIKALDTV